MALFFPTIQNYLMLYYCYNNISVFNPNCLIDNITQISPKFPQKCNSRYCLIHSVNLNSNQSEKLDFLKVMV